mgnify:CR=1 FL=1
MADKKLINYRDNVLDIKSKSFCGAKWGNSTLWLNTGETSSCHLPPVHKINIDQIKQDPSKLHNTDHKIRMRNMMKQGEKPKECDYCWKIESMGEEYLSDRLFKSIQFTIEEMDEWFKQSARTKVIPPTLEITFDRLCNFACSYCNANFSTTWAKDIKENGFYKLKTAGGGAFKHDGSPNNAWENTTNPFIEAFWKWWPELSKGLRVLRITGGEPLLSMETWKLIDLYIEEKLEFEVGINSNLGFGEKLLNKLIKKSFDMKSVTIFTSMETVDEHAEYIRDGLDYNKWKNNVERILLESDIRRITCMFTVNALCLFRITELLDQLMEWKYLSDKSVGISINFLRFPAFQSLTVLDHGVREEASKRITEWYEKNKFDSKLDPWEKSDIERLISYVSVVEDAHLYDNDLEVNTKDFRSFYKQYDERRNKSFDVFPKFLLHGESNE